MSDPTKEEFAAIKAKFPSAQAFSCEGRTFVGRKPNRLEYKRFRQQLLREETRADAHESLLPCVVWPDRAQLDAILEDMPVLEVTLGNALLALIGNESKLEKKEI